MRVGENVCIGRRCVLSNEGKVLLGDSTTSTDGLKPGGRAGSLRLRCVSAVL